MIRRKRMTLTYRGGPYDGRQEEMLVGPGSVGIEFHEYEDKHLLGRHSYVIERVNGQPIHLSYTGAVRGQP